MKATFLRYSLIAHLVVNETPLLKESMDAHNSAYISRQISPACRNCKIFDRIQTVCVDHEVSIVLIYCWCLASIPVVEEFREGLALNIIDLVHIKPSAVTWQDDGMCLGDKMLSC